MSDINFLSTDSQEIYDTIMLALEEGVGEPLNPGDERRIYGEATAALWASLYSMFNDRSKQRLLRYARGEVLDEIGARVDTPRLEPAKAKVTMRFTVSAPQPNNIIIPEGTKVTPDGEVYFATVQTALLQANRSYVDVVAECTVGGEAYNGYSVGSITTLVDLVPYIGSVSNTTPSTGGDDGEPYTVEGDEKYRERIRLAPAKQSTAGPESGYRYFALSADPGIIDVAIDSPSANVIKIYPLMAGGELPDEETLAKVLAACSADKVRPMTDQVEVLAPVAVSYDIEIKYYCTQDNEADTVQTIEAEGGAIDRYNEWQTAALDRDINPDQLRRFVLSPNWTSGLVGADRVDVVKPVFTEIGKHQVAQFSGKLTITHEVVS